MGAPFEQRREAAEVACRALCEMVDKLGLVALVIVCDLTGTRLICADKVAELADDSILEFADFIRAQRAASS